LVAWLLLVAGQVPPAAARDAKDEQQRSLGYLDPSTLVTLVVGWRLMPPPRYQHGIVVLSPLAEARDGSLALVIDMAAD
jgi:hypothetical protein